MASELKTLISSNTIRVLDRILVTRDEDGFVEPSGLRDADDSEVGELRALERDLAILLAEADGEDIGASLEPGSAAAVLVWKNTWAAPFGSAVRRSGGELGQRPDPDACAHRGCRSGSPSRNERSMKMGLFRDRGDRPGCCGDSPMRAPTSKTDGPLAAVAYNASHGSVTW